LLGIAGNCFALDFADPRTPSIGASTAIFGMFGGMAAFVLLNWWKLPTQQRGYFICIVAFIIIMNFLFGLGASMSGRSSGGKGGTKDVLAHVGGLLSGICFGMWICEWKAQPTTYKKWEFVVKLSGYISSGLFVVLTVMGFTVFRTVKDIQM
jgi:membrane associated rhomboid family serine protease